VTKEEKELRHALRRQCLKYARYLRGTGGYIELKKGISFGPDMKQRLRDYLLGLFDGIQITNNMHPSTVTIKEIRKL